MAVDPSADPSAEPDASRDGLVAAAIALLVVATVVVGALAPPTAAPTASNVEPVNPATDPGCAEWSDGCRVCQRTGDEVACSMPGIACTLGEAQCQRRAGSP